MPGKQKGRPKKSRVKPMNDRQFVMLFHQQPDRIAGIVAFAHLEATLEETLRTWLAEGDEIDRAFDPTQKGFLGGYAPKVDLALGLGILASEQRTDLMRWARVRNHFAHHILEADSFDADPVAQLVRELQVMKPRPGDSPISLRETYLYAVYFMAKELKEYERPRLPLDEFRANARQGTEAGRRHAHAMADALRSYGRRKE